MKKIEADGKKIVGSIKNIFQKSKSAEAEKKPKNIENIDPEVVELLDKLEIPLSDVIIPGNLAEPL